MKLSFAKPMFMISICNGGLRSIQAYGGAFVGRSLSQARSYSKTSLKMKLQTAIVGLPNVGKSTLFNALTESQGAESANYRTFDTMSNIFVSL